jgi:hypothetical protein
MRFRLISKSVADTQLYFRSRNDVNKSLASCGNRTGIIVTAGGKR